MVLLFLLVLSLLVFIDYRIEKSFISPYIIISLPYLIIVLLNEIVFSNAGFYSIGNKTLFVVFLALVCFFCGSFVTKCFFKCKVTKTYSQTHSSKLENYKMSYVFWYSVFIEVAVTLRIAYLLCFEGGLSSIIAGNSVLISGIIGHLQITLYASLPMLLLYSIEKKDYKALIVFLFGVLLFFLSFIKYHVIALCIISFLFVSFERRDIERKGAIIICVSCVALFVLNYIVDFVKQGTISSVHGSFFINHLWKYIGGGLITSSIVLGSSFHPGISMSYRIGQYLVALPNMFLNKMFNFNLFAQEKAEFGFIAVANNSETSNVADSISSLFLCCSSVTDFIMFCMVFFLFGLFACAWFCYARKNKTCYHLGLMAFLCFFCFLSFFGEYASLAQPWETIVVCAVIPVFFQSRVRISRSVSMMCQ